jgi:hypothetical protein
VLASLRLLRWWQLVLSALPFLLPLSQAGYFGSENFHAAFGVVLGLVVAVGGFTVNMKVAERRWPVLAQVAAMLGVLVGCFVVIELIALILTAALPAHFFDR